MTRANYWENNDGLQVPFGTSDGIQKEAGSVHTKGSDKELRVVLDHSNLPGETDELQDNNQYIPSGAVILSAEFHATEVFSAPVTIGTTARTSSSDITGSVVDADGLVTNGTTAFAAATLYGGDVSVSTSGAQVGTQATDDWYISVSDTSVTSGAGELVVKYRI